MSTSAALPGSHHRRVLADVFPRSIVADIALVVGAAIFVGLLAQVNIHLGFTPVPITGQTLGVLLAGSALGWRRGSIAMALYVVAGIIGVPWYSGHAHGWTAATGATGGYLLGFIAAAAVCGLLAQQGNDRKHDPFQGLQDPRDNGIKFCDQCTTALPTPKERNCHPNWSLPTRDCRTGSDTRPQSACGARDALSDSPFGVRGRHGIAVYVCVD